jgi:methylmalonyl-CoA/ethylmalonyl-CoA epimerase
MKKCEIDHIGIKVSSIDNAVKAFEAIGIKCGKIETYDEVGLKIVFSDTGETKTELLEVINESSPIAKDRLGVNHVALQTDDVEFMFAKMKEDPKFKVFGNIRRGAQNKKLFFFRITEEEDVLYEYVEETTAM